MAQPLVIKAAWFLHLAGLADAKASVVVETRVGALKSRFEKSSSVEGGGVSEASEGREGMENPCFSLKG